MTDHDPHPALQRGDGLTGEPAPDLLARQRRRRVTGLAAVVAVVIVAAGVTLGISAAARPDRTAAGSSSTVSPGVPAPTAPSGQVTSPAPAAATAPATSTAPTTAPATSSAPAPQTTAPVATAAPPCPSSATLQAALTALTPEGPGYTDTMVPGETPVCSGSWAGAGYTASITYASEEPGGPSETYTDGQAGLFQHTGGRWVMLPRDGHCDDPAIPRVVWERACNVD